MACANCGLIAKRALQTRQMIFVPAVSSLIICSSQNPISRNRTATSFDVQSRLIRSGIPALTWFKGQVSGAGHRLVCNWLTIDSVAALILRIPSSRAEPRTNRFLPFADHFLLLQLKPQLCPPKRNSCSVTLLMKVRRAPGIKPRKKLDPSQCFRGLPESL